MSENSTSPAAYRLDAQVGFILRRASQRHLSIFSASIHELTPTQFAVLAKLNECQSLSQNALGRETAMDAATVKGVVDRLVRRELLATTKDKKDRRRTNVALTAEGTALYHLLEKDAQAITQDTLAPLGSDERAIFLKLLNKLS